MRDNHSSLRKAAEAKIIPRPNKRGDIHARITFSRMLMEYLMTASLQCHYQNYAALLSRLNNRQKFNEAGKYMRSFIRNSYFVASSETARIFN